MTDLNSLPVLDPASMAELCQASPTRANRLMGYYLEDLPTQVDAIVTALQASRPADISAVAHSLKSSSRQMGALQLGEAAFRVEQAARQLPPDPYLPQFVQSLQSLVPPTITAIRAQMTDVSHS